jgi:hypothetical protein
MDLNTSQQYDQAVNSCKDIFIKKTIDYGTSWRVLRLISITDQIYIKAKRIRTIQEKKSQKVADDITSELKGIINYAVIGLIQIEIGNAEIDELTPEQTALKYDQMIAVSKTTMMDKNHDYGEAWREMSQESFIDLILMSEGIDANFIDIMNYAIFGLILISEQKPGHSS